MTAGHVSYSSNIQGFEATTPYVGANSDLGLTILLRGPTAYSAITIKANALLAHSHQRSTIDVPILVRIRPARQHF